MSYNDSTFESDNSFCDQEEKNENIEKSTESITQINQSMRMFNDITDFFRRSTSRLEKRSFGSGK